MTKKIMEGYHIVPEDTVGVVCVKDYANKKVLISFTTTFPKGSDAARMRKELHTVVEQQVREDRDEVYTGLYVSREAAEALHVGLGKLLAAPE